MPSVITHTETQNHVKLCYMCVMFSRRFRRVIVRIGTGRRILKQAEKDEENEEDNNKMLIETIEFE